MTQNKTEFNDVSEWLVSVIDHKHRQKDISCTYSGHDAKVSVIFVGLGKNNLSTLWHYEKLIENRTKESRNILLLAKGYQQCKLAEAAASLWKLKNNGKWKYNIWKYDDMSKIKHRVLTVEILLSCNNYKDVLTRQFHENYKGPIMELPQYNLLDDIVITDNLESQINSMSLKKTAIKERIWKMMRKIISK